MNNSSTGKPLAGFVFNSDVCVYDGINVGKPPKLPAEAGTCGLAASGTVQGYCGALTGSASGNIFPGGPVPASSNTRLSVNLKITGVATQLLVSGTVTKISNGRAGKIKGAINLHQDGTAGSCLNKGPKGFTAEGALAVKICNSGKNATTNLCN